MISCVKNIRKLYIMYLCSTNCCNEFKIYLFVYHLNKSIESISILMLIVMSILHTSQKFGIENCCKKSQNHIYILCGSFGRCVHYNVIIIYDDMMSKEIYLYSSKEIYFAQNILHYIYLYYS